MVMNFRVVVGKLLTIISYKLTFKNKLTSLLIAIKFCHSVLICYMSLVSFPDLCACLY